MNPWYADGLRFHCTQCGDCCSGDPGVVWVTEEEIQDLATLLGIEGDEFSRRYVRRFPEGRSLIEFENGDCVFFDGKARGCTVYEARPTQCRTWPFWPANVRHEESWRQACEACPGSGGGDLVPLESIQRRLAEHTEAKQRGRAQARATENRERSS